jgi:hypothetical protein
MLTPDDLQHFRQQGFLLLRNVLRPDTVDTVRPFLTGASDAALDQLRAAYGDRPLPELNNIIDRQAQRPDFEDIDDDLRMAMSGHYPREVRLSETLWAIPRDPGLREALETIFGQDELYMHMPPVARFVMPGNRHAGVPAHQDVSYNKHMRDFVTVWCPWVSINERCGGVAVFKNSNEPVERLDNTDQRFWLKGVPTAGHERVAFDMEPGDALVLSPWVIHQSVPNTSTGLRISTDCRFMPGPGMSSKHVLDMQAWRVLEPAATA